MKRAMLLMLLLVAFAGCGSDSGTSSPTGPTTKLKVQIRGDQAVIAVKTQEDGADLCNEIQADWPAELEGYDQVSFDVPDTGSDVTCVAP